MSEDRHREPEDYDEPPSFFPIDEEQVDKEFVPGEPVECRIEAVFAAQTGESVQRFVLVTDGHRKLPIVIGGFEATAITYSLGGQQPDRPMTHDLFKTVLDKLDAVVEKILIDDLWGSTYYAKIFLKTKSGEIVIDSRPSDAIALAVRTDSPIFVVEGILERSPS